MALATSKTGIEKSWNSLELILIASKGFLYEMFEEMFRLGLCAFVLLAFHRMTTIQVNATLTIFNF